uniref:Putative fungal ankyrin repeat-containing protein n=1 Tax=Adineta vaga TaxID=104782 RepID=G3KGW4_ADIVA|nr:putative fungal ankyrin repeat-containing protein [Adineta vaga]
MTNFESRFKSHEWIEAIDFNIFHISDGCILNSLCCEPFLDACDQQVDVNYNGDSYNEFKHAVVGAFANLTSLISKNTGHHAHNELIKKDNGIYIAKLHFGITLCFRFKYVPDATTPISYVLHSSDIDISQIAYTGSQVVCTFAFLQAIATKSFICYTLYEDMTKCVYNRINRYCQRGFVFLEPQPFNTACYLDIMVKTVFDTKTVETRQILNDDEELQTVTITREPSLLPYFNIDPYFLQETFIKQICCQKI